MFSSDQIEANEITQRLRAAVEGVEPSRYSWEKIEARIALQSRNRPGLGLRAERSIQVYMATALILLGIAAVSWNLVRSQPDTANGQLVATFDSGTAPLVQVGDKYVAIGGPAFVRSNGVDQDLVAVLDDPGVMQPTDPLLQIPLAFHDIGEALLDRALLNLASTEFTVSSLHGGRTGEKTLIFDWIVQNYYEGHDLTVYEIVDERDCVTTPIDVPGAGSMTVCQLYAKEDGVKIGESYTMPVYTVTEGTYSPGGEVTVRVDDRRSNVTSALRSTVYQGSVDLWRVIDGQVEHRYAISTGDFDLVGGRDWQATGLALSQAEEVVEWMLAMQMPESTVHPDGTQFVAGDLFTGSSFSVTEIVPNADESIMVIDASRDTGFYGSPETLRFEIDLETELPKRMLFTRTSNLPYATAYSLVLPIVFEFEYPGDEE